MRGSTDVNPQTNLQHVFAVAVAYGVDGESCGAASDAGGYRLGCREAYQKFVQQCRGGRQAASQVRHCPNERDFFVSRLESFCKCCLTSNKSESSSVIFHNLVCLSSVR